MTSPCIDLHTHTRLSDGRLTPEQLVAAAYAAGIRVLGITDHNSTSDLTALRCFAADRFEEEMLLLQGAEISARYTDTKGFGHELHIVALGFDPEDPEMKALLAQHQPDRRPYVNAMLKRLREECGIDLGTYDEIRSLFPDTRYIGRMVLARLLTQRGYTATVDEAFHLYLGSHGLRRAYVKNPLQYRSLEDVIRVILHSGGIPVLAHLLYYDLGEPSRTSGPEKEALVRRFRELTDLWGGPGGMEVCYARYTPEEQQYLQTLADRYGLLPSAGSDYHAQEVWETLEHRIPCSRCAALLDRLGIRLT